MSASTWDDLYALRRNGHRPALRVIVTDSKRLCWRMHDIGCMTILHEPGTPMPIEILEGLDVILWFGNCQRAALVWRAMRAKQVTPDRCMAWCECSQELTTCAGKCSDMHEIDEQFEVESASK